MSNLKLVSSLTPPLKVNGVGRDAEMPRSLTFYFDRVPSDDELRYLHDVIRRAVPMTGGDVKHETTI